jgi:phospholipid/cholesterol/gamma-HCH transport system substrate-binding protein
VIKTAPTLGRIAVMTLFALSTFGLLLFLWIAFGGSTPLAPKGYRFDVQFQEATQLANQADVRISGVNVGKVVHIAPAPNHTRATIELADRYSPIPKDTKAVLRLKTLLGETFVELTPGHRSGGVVPEGGSLPDGAVSPTVELDEIMSTFDPKTREAWRTWMQSQSQAVKGRGADINAFFGEAPGFVEEMDRLMATLDAQQSATRKMVSTTATVFDAISRREGELRGLVTDSERLFSTTAARNRDLAAIFQRLPRFQRESIETLPQITAFGRDARPVIRELQPAASAMQPVFRSLDELSPEFDGFFARLDAVISASEKGIPAFETVLREMPPLLADFEPFLRNANPMVDFIGRYRREVTAFFANTTAASLSRDVALPKTTLPVHYLRTSQTLSPDSLTFYPRPLADSRQNAYMLPNAMDLLKTGLPVLSTATCANGEPAPPETADPETLAPLIEEYAFRTAGRDVAAPPCNAQGVFPGWGTAYPQLRAEP